MAADMKSYWLFIEKIREGNIDEVRNLLFQGVDIHTDDDSGLQYAVNNGDFEIVKFLVGHGANIHARDDDALIMASRHGHFEVVKFLVEQGANLGAQDHEALRIAASFGHLEIVKVLVEKGADIYSQNYESSLYWATYQGRLEVIKYLISKSTDDQQKNTMIQSVLSSAQKNNRDDVIQYILENYYLDKLDYSNITECIVCMESNDVMKGLTLVCHPTHTLCSSCVESLRKLGQLSCPICRQANVIPPLYF